jgi:lipopolysaccharide export system protein LptA
MNFKKLTVSSWLIAISYLFAADISAPKMEILDTPEGRVTSFPQGITITDKDAIITGKNALFYERDNRAKIFDSLLINTPQFKITADTAYYQFTEKKSMLKGNVKVESETLLINTPILTFEQGRNLVKAHDSVSLKEKQQNLTIESKYGEYNFTDAVGIADSSPTLYIERSDTTVIKSNKMMLDNKNDKFFAIDSVSAVSAKSTLKCDTLLFFIKEDSGLAYGHPRVFDSKNQINGNLIKFYFAKTDSQQNIQDKTSLKNVKVLQAANATYTTDDGGILEVFGNIFSISYKNGDIDYITVSSDTLSNVTGKFTPKKEL